MYIGVRRGSRTENLMLWVTPQEKELIHRRMEQAGTRNMSAYMRKIAIDGLIVKLDIPQMKEMISLLRRSSNNLNQIAKRMNETGRFYDTDMEEVQMQQEQLWKLATESLTKLGEIK